MLRSKRAQRIVLVAYIRELANVAAGSLLFGQFLSDRPYPFFLALLGKAAWVALNGITFLFTERERE